MMTARTSWSLPVIGLCVYGGCVAVLVTMHTAWSQTVLSFLAGIPGIVLLFWASGVLSDLGGSVWSTLKRTYKRLGLWKALLFVIAFQANIMLVDSMAEYDRPVANAVTAALAQLLGVGIAYVFWLRNQQGAMRLANRERQ